MTRAKLGIGLFFLLLLLMFCLIILSPVTASFQQPTITKTATATLTNTPQVTITKTKTATPTATTPSTISPTLTPPIAFISTENILHGQVKLTIPSIQVDHLLEAAAIIDTKTGPVFTTPKNNPIWIPDWSANIGQPGISMIYGHRQWGPTPKVFTDLDKLKPGDQAFILSPGFLLTYTFSESQVIEPGDIWTVAIAHDTFARSVGKNQLMLITCTPWGSSKQRLIVFLNLEGVSVTQ